MNIFKILSQINRQQDRRNAVECSVQIRHTNKRAKVSSIIIQVISPLGLLGLVWILAEAVLANQIPTTPSTPSPTWNVNATSTTATKDTPSGLRTTVSISGSGMTMGVINNTALQTENTVTAPALPTATNGVQVLATANSSCSNSSLTCNNLGTVTFNFTDTAGNPIKVKNPVIHMSRLGGFNSYTTSQGVSAKYNLGAVLKLTTPATGASLGIASGARGFAVASNTISPSLGSFPTSSNNIGTCTASPSAPEAGCGSIPVTGLVSSLSFNVDLLRDNTSGSWQNLFSGTWSADGIYFTVSFDEDFGDAPASYDPTTAASHLVSDLALGATVDADNTNVNNGGADATASVTPSPNAVTAGASNNGVSGDGVDEDAISTFPALATNSSSYSLTVPISGASSAGRVCGWIDLNRNNIFDNSTERVCSSFASGATSTVLNWTGLSGLTAGNNYVRLRASYDTAGVQSPTGRLNSGEVEDYQIAIAAPSFSISGTVFEDPNYGGGAGRPLSTPTTSPRDSARVELYKSDGTYISSTTTSGGGKYTFSSVSSGDYFVRVVNSTVTSSRGTGSILPVQTFRVNDSTGTPTDDTARVGGEKPSVADTGAANTGAVLNTTTFAFTTAGGSVTAGGQAQSIAPVKVGSSNVTGIDFGYNFDTIVNTNDSGQGSLRQFITNSNALTNTGLNQVANPSPAAGTTAVDPATGEETSIFMIPDGTARPGLRAGLTSQLTSGVAVITPTTQLPTITNTFTTIDARTQTANIGDSNSGQQGTGGTVGVDNLTLSKVNKPEVQISGTSAISTGFTVGSSNTTIRGMAIYGFGNTLTKGNIVINTNANNPLIEENFLGFTALNFSRPPGGNQGSNIVIDVSTNGIVQNNLIAYADSFGLIGLGSDSGWKVQNNEIRDNSFNDPSKDGISFESGSSNNQVIGNLIISQGGNGIDSWNATGPLIIENNTITGNGLGSTTTIGETPGIRLYGTGNKVYRNLIFDNYGAGVMVTNGSTKNTISQNSIYGNGTVVSTNGTAASGQIGIDLLTSSDNANTGTASYVSANDGAATTGGNVGMDYPIITSSTLSGSTLTLKGFVGNVATGSSTFANATLEFFISEGTNQNNGEVIVGDGKSKPHGEGKTYIGSCTADGNGLFGNATSPCVLNNVPSALNDPSNITATATNANGNTSEFSSAPLSNPMDYGDAPDTYGTDNTANNSSNTSDPVGANHIIVSGLFLGATRPDNETNGFVDGTDNNNNATDDDDPVGTGAGNGDDEDNFTLPTLTAGATSYTIPASNITATNTIGQAATLHAWVDFNKNGKFDSTEYASVAVNSGTTGGNPTANLTWSGISVGTTGNTYARFRLTSDSSITSATPGGAANNGEVEDYQIAIAALPPASCSLRQELDNAISLDFSRVPSPNPNSNDPVGTVYTFSNVAPGINAKVTLEALQAATVNRLLLTSTGAGVLGANLRDPSSGLFEFNVKLVDATTGLPIPPIDLAITSFDIDGTSGNTVTDFAQFVNPNGYFLNSPTFLTSSLTSNGVKFTNTNTGVDDTVNNSQYAAGAFYFDTNSFTIRGGLQNGSAAASRTVTFDVKTSNLNNFSNLNCSSFSPTTVSVFGNIFDDFNHSKIQDGSEIGTNAGGLNALLINDSNRVVAMATVNSDGTYSFSNVPANASYKVQITTNTATIGSTPPTIVLPTDWISTGENLKGTPDSTVDSQISFTVSDRNMTEVNFGIISSPLDYGDAPDTYGTNSTNNNGEGIGANHLITNLLTLGANNPDAETDAQTPLDGTGDGVDEDAFTTLADVPTVGNYNLTVPVTNNSDDPATLHAWIDFNQNGKFEVGEYQSTIVPIVATSATLSWAVPSGMTPGNTYARFRLTSTPLSDDTSTDQQDERSVGAANDGEVEDYPVAIAASANPNLSPDFCQTSASRNLLFILDDSNSVIGKEVQQQRDAVMATLNSFVAKGLTGQAAIVGFEGKTVNIIGYTDITSANLTTFNNALKSYGPPGGATNWEAGFRAGTALGVNQPDVVFFFTDGVQNTGGSPEDEARQFKNAGAHIYGIGIDGLTIDDGFKLITDGEDSVIYDGSNILEADYVDIDNYGTLQTQYANAFLANLCPVDFGDAPDTYGTDNIANNNSSDPLGANHKIVSGLYLGTKAPDPEFNGFVDGADNNQDATDDDDAIGTGTGNGDDENNLTLPVLQAGKTSYTIPANNITVTNTTTQAATLHVWIDFNKNDKFDPSEHSLVAVPLGTNGGHPSADLTWSGISVVTSRNTYARFRLTSDSSINSNTPGGAANSGEVEDYQVAIAFEPNLLLVKRITAINPGKSEEILFNNFVDDPNTIHDNHPLWPDANLYLQGAIDADKVKPGDEVEYTVYFLSNGDASAKQVKICDAIPDHMTFVKNAYGVELGIGLGLDSTALPTSPNLKLSNLLNDDQGDFYGPGTAPPTDLCKKVSPTNTLVDVDDTNNDNGAVVIKLPNLPKADSAGSPIDSYGFIRFRAKVK